MKKKCRDQRIYTKNQIKEKETIKDLTFFLSEYGQNKCHQENTCNNIISIPFSLQTGTGSINN